MCYNALAYSYKLRKENGHVIHILELDQRRYKAQFVKAHDQVIGRETVKSMAERSNATIAINGGFFEIGGSIDGKPSGTLIIDGKIFGIKDTECASLIQDGDQLSIRHQITNIELAYGKRSIKVDKYNIFPESEDVVLYTDSWGRHSLTNFNTRSEVAFDEHYHKIAAYDHGNNAIPKNGYVISFSKSYLTKHKLNIKKDMTLSLPYDAYFSSVAGIPMLVSNGQISDEIFQDSAFYTMPHARTAIGLTSNNKIIIVVAEHVYKQDINAVTLGDMKPLITSSNMLVSELQKIVYQKYRKRDLVKGLTIPELANLMIELGATSAINLDGGGSSTMLVRGKIVNKTIGDVDEAMGQDRMRPVSDAIVFTKKKHAYSDQLQKLKH